MILPQFSSLVDYISTRFDLSDLNRIMFDLNYEVGDLMSPNGKSQTIINLVSYSRNIDKVDELFHMMCYHNPSNFVTSRAKELYLRERPVESKPLDVEGVALFLQLNAVAPKRVKEALLELQLEVQAM